VRFTKRTTLLVDRQVQGALLWRIIVYWQFLVVSISLVLLAWDYYHTPSTSLAQAVLNVHARYGPVLFASLLLLPLIMFDVVRITNRIVGPVVRMRQALRDVADGLPAQPLNFRDNDLWRELGTEYNRAAARIARDASERSVPTEEMAPAAAAPKA
jgi:hypothetical protein